MFHLLLAELVEEAAKLRLDLAGHGRVDGGHLMMMMMMVKLMLMMMMVKLMMMMMMMMMMVKMQLVYLPG